MTIEELEILIKRSMGAWLALHQPWVIAQLVLHGGKASISELRAAYDSRIEISRDSNYRSTRQRIKGMLPTLKKHGIICVDGDQITLNCGLMPAEKLRIISLCLSKELAGASLGASLLR
jgi:hypothetical protein